MNTDDEDAIKCDHTELYNQEERMSFMEGA